MLRSQYGVASSSSVTPTALHAEDAQPNEVIYKRRHGHPPQIGSTWNGDSGIKRGGYSGPWTQMRGNSLRRGRGNSQPNRGGHTSNQRNTGQVHRSTNSTHHSVPPIATLPDVEYRIPSSSNSSSFLIKPGRQPDSPVTVIRDIRLPQAEPHYKVDGPTSSAPTSSERRLVDDYRWLHRSRSPSPKLPQSAFKRRKFEHQPTHVSNSKRNEDSVISQSAKHHSLTAEPTRPKSIDNNLNKPLLPGRHRRFEGSAPVHALHSPEPLVLVQVKTAVSSTAPIILAETSTLKQEPRTPSPAPSLRMERNLITSSCKFYPIPEFCKKTFPGFKENRKTFFKEKMQELTRLGLTKIKSFFRDDGLAIEWRSKVPVWSDTLLPEFPDLASAIKHAHQLNHQTPSPKRKRQSAERNSRESSLKNNNTNIMEPNESKRLRHSLEIPRIQGWAGEVEIVGSPTMSFRNPSSPTPTSSFNHGDHPSTTVVPLLNTPKFICLDPEVVPHMGDSEPITSAIPQQKTSAMDVDTPTPIQPPKPARRMQFKPVLPGRRNRSKISSVQVSTLLTSDSDKPLSTSLSLADGHSKKDKLEVTSRAQDVVFLQEQPTSPHPRPPLLSRNCTPTLPPRHHQEAQEVGVPDTRVSLSKDEDHGNATDTDLDAELVVDLLLLGTPEEPLNRNCLPNPPQQEITEVLPLHKGHEDEDDRDGVSAVKDTAAVEGLATQFLQRYLQLFDVDRLKLEAAYAKNALFSCHIHHVQEPSFSMAGLFARESSRSRQGFNVSLSDASISAIEMGRAQIVNRLLELGPHRFCPRGVPRTVDYNVVPLSSVTGGGILLTVHGEVVNPHLAGPQMDHILSVDQNFVLRKRELEDEDEDEEEGKDGFGKTLSSTTASNLWPLVAVSHQMTVRDAVPFQFEHSDGLTSRIKGS